jgi:DNA-binding GntR family transcriptional regulator
MGDVPGERRIEMPTERVTADMRQRLESGEWASGSALPPVAELATHYKVSRTSVSRALKILENEGLIQIIPRWGTFKT